MAEINEEGIIVSDNTLYVPQTWIDEVDECTQISAERLNHMELGIANCAERWDSLSQGNYEIAMEPDFSSTLQHHATSFGPLVQLHFRTLRNKVLTHDALIGTLPEAIRPTSMERTVPIQIYNADGANQGVAFLILAPSGPIRLRSVTTTDARWVYGTGVYMI